jgi:hypothetical protein
MDVFVLTGINKPASLELVPGLNRLGRNPTNDFRVHDATVSSFHCEIRVADDSVVVRDLCSTNGTFIDGRPIQEAPLRLGQVLQLGSAEFRLDKRPTRDAELMHIAIPKIGVAPPPAPALLPDGSPACLHHRAVAATRKCTRCAQTYCDECVRVVGITGSKSMTFCPDCSGPCEPLPSTAVLAAAKAKKQSFLGRLKQTIKIRRG